MSYKEEVGKVQELGEAIGYGNLMEIASLLWEIHMLKTNTPVSGVFVPAPKYSVTLTREQKERREVLLKEIRLFFRTKG